MPSPINVGDTVTYASAVGPWTGEVLEIFTATALVRPVDPGHAGSDPYELPLADLTRTGDPDGMRADGCDDVGVTGRVRPMHRHAVSGRAHAHPNGGEPHTHTELGRWQQEAAAALAALPEKVALDALVAEAVTAGPPDPVEIVADRIAARRMADNVGPSYTTPGDIEQARDILALLVSGPWHLVTGQRQTGTVMRLAGGGSTPGERLIEIHREWKP
jgi:hypothetical protein